jgi:hypothetical protein
MIDERHAREASMLRTREGRTAFRTGPAPGLLLPVSTGASARRATSSWTSGRGREDLYVPFVCFHIPVCPSFEVAFVGDRFSGVLPLVLRHQPSFFRPAHGHLDAGREEKGQFLLCRFVVALLFGFLAFLWQADQRKRVNIPSTLFCRCLTVFYAFHSASRPEKKSRHFCPVLELPFLAIVSRGCLRQSRSIGHCQSDQLVDV